MPKQMKAAPKRAAAPDEGQVAVMEEPQDIHTAEIEGDNVVAMDDEAELARILRLKGDPYRLVMKSDGKPVETGDPDYHYAWADDIDMPDRLEIGFVLFDDDRIIAPAQLPGSRQRDGLLVKGQRAIRMPMSRWKAYQRLEQQDVDDDLTSANRQAKWAEEIDRQTGRTVRSVEREGLQYYKSGL